MGRVSDCLGAVLSKNTARYFYNAVKGELRQQSLGELYYQRPPWNHPSENSSLRLRAQHQYSTD
jgi:hypothetical protein